MIREGFLEAVTAELDLREERGVTGEGILSPLLDLNT